MNLAFSNLAWPLQSEEAALRLLSGACIRGVEVAPTRLWPDWHGASTIAAKAYSQSLATRGFSIPALQAILFAKPELQLFGSDQERQQLADHLEKVSALAAAFGASNLVFGAPKNRQLGERTASEAASIALELFRYVAPRLERFGVCLCLEANPQAYACTFVTSSREAAKLVRAVNEPGFGLHLDTACMHLAGDDIRDSIENNLDILRHFHVSEPFLADFSAPIIDHQQVAAVLRGAKYKGWVSLEMRESDQPLEDVLQASSFLERTYSKES